MTAAAIGLANSMLADIVLSAARGMTSTSRALAADNLAEMREMVERADALFAISERELARGAADLDGYHVLGENFAETATLRMLVSAADTILDGNNGNLDPNYAMFVAALRISRNLLTALLTETGDRAASELARVPSGIAHLERFFAAMARIAELRMLAAVLEGLDERIALRGGVDFPHMKEGT